MYTTAIVPIFISCFLVYTELKVSIGLRDDIRNKYQGQRFADFFVEFMAEAALTPCLEALADTMIV